MSTITWLHLSDLHFRADELHKWAQDIVLSALMKDVRERIESDGLHPDLILVSGDIAFSGLPQEYELAREFFDELLKVTSLSKDRLLVVPGNHDVDRTAISMGARTISASLNNRQIVAEVLTSEQDRRLLFRKFDAYARFVSDYFAGKIPFDDERYFYTLFFDLADRRIAVLGINSAWLSAGNEDRGRLVMGERQVRQAIGDSEMADLRITLVHHPFDWLQDFDRDDCEALLMSKCNFILHGHLHRTGLQSLSTPDASAMIIAAGASYETRQSSNAYNWVRLELEAGQGTSYLRRYSEQRGGFWARYPLTYKNVENGEFTFPLPSPTTARAVSKPTPTSSKPEGEALRRAATPQWDEKTYALLRTSYLTCLFENTARLSLGGIDPKAAADSKDQLSLDGVYTALLTLTPEEHDRMQKEGITSGRESRSLSALALLNEYRRLVLLGDPGSGKTTFVNFVAMCLAGENLGKKQTDMKLLTAPLPDDEGKDQDDLQPWDHGPLLSVRVILRDFAAKGLPSHGEKANADHLWRFIAAELGETLAEYASHLRQELLEKGGAILLDGLDEVAEAEQQRGQIKDAVEDFAAKFHRCRMLVTSRTYAYQKQQWRLPSFAEGVLASFSKGQIHRFVDRWYGHVGPLRGFSPDDTQGKAVLLKRAIFGSDRLLALAERPLLLTLMASLHAWRGGNLPEKRVELYADAVDLLLYQWESGKIRHDSQGRPVDVEPSISEYLATGRDVVRKVIEERAYTAHSAQPDVVGTADIPQRDLVDKLMNAKENPDAKPARLIEYLSNRAGLLLARGKEIYTFVHRTFQEYLAACHLTRDKYPGKIAGLARKEPDRWREVALLAGAKAGRGTDYAVWALAEALCYRLPNKTGGDDEEDIWGAHLAGMLLSETANLADLGDADTPKLERVREWLVQILVKGYLSSVECVTAGNTLARLGDPRFRSDQWHLPDEPLLGFVEIPAGPFLMGSDKKRDPQAGDGEIPQHEITLSQCYIARYPVTVAQFKAFVDDSKYQLQSEESIKGMDNHPVVNVSWHDAMKYCDWLTDTLRKWEGTPEPLATLLRTGANGTPPWRVTLPSEAEWEKAARGTDGRIYPWGDNPHPNLANYYASGIGATGAVGCFPGGNSPYKCLDMAGNVWEWTRSLWGKDWKKADYKYPVQSIGWARES